MRTLSTLWLSSVLALTAGCLGGAEPDCARANSTCDDFNRAYCEKEAQCGGDLDACRAQNIDCALASGVRGDADGCIEAIEEVRCSEFPENGWFKEACEDVVFDRDTQCLDGRFVGDDSRGDDDSDDAREDSGSGGDGQCTGVSPQSCGGLIEGNCNTTFGCLWNEFDGGGGFCSGAPPPCDYWEEEFDCIFFGCEWAE